MEEELLRRLDAVTAQYEQEDILNQNETYISWNTKREATFEEHITNVKREKRKLELADKLLELKSRQEKLKFFEHLGEISVGIANVPKEEEETGDLEEKEVFVSAPTASGRRAK